MLYSYQIDDLLVIGLASYSGLICRSDNALLRHWSALEAGLCAT